MEKPLDDNFVNELGVLHFNEKGTGFLTVDQNNWQEELYHLERLANFNCITIMVLAIILFFLPTEWGIIFLAAGVAIGYMYKKTVSKKFRNLIQHGFYQYEIYDDRVVRYSNVWFRKFYFSEIIEIKKKDFGMLIVKNYRSDNYYLDHENPEIIVIPNKIQGYNQIEKYLLNIKLAK